MGIEYWRIPLSKCVLLLIGVVRRLPRVVSSRYWSVSRRHHGSCLPIFLRAPPCLDWLNSGQDGPSLSGTQPFRGILVPANDLPLVGVPTLIVPLTA
ncbi:hypothetical protein L210DRAFT_952869 [Boletus edulis BED1]|uniref:Secreted protein n=1 Tax=Boletus edulis BED1 TaxID=1328754 RepID=A0AAD4BZW4_BOLED|nr:hypothetical protein L210DRAFT_952869 [Boletus edulis BED1]